MKLVTNEAVLCRNKVSQNFPEIRYATLYYWLKNYAVCEIYSGFCKSQQNQTGLSEDVAVCCWVSGCRHLREIGNQSPSDATRHPVMQHHIPKKLELHFELN